MLLKKILKQILALIYILIILLILLLQVINATSNLRQPGRTKIIGGKSRNISQQFFYQVSLQKLNYFGTKSHHCGGSIISNHCILTAAHCLIGFKPTDFIIKVDSQKLAATTNTAENGNFELDEVEAQELLPFPDYGNNNEMEHDIGIIKIQVKSGVKIEQNNIQTIPFLKFKSEIPVNTSCTISGWGYTDEYDDTSISEVLLYANIPIWNESDCKARYNGHYKIFESMICAGHSKGGINSCYGDSGGPMVCDGKLVGITSFGIGCARAEYPGVYTKVSHYLKWIESHNCFNETLLINNYTTSNDNSPADVINIISKTSLSSKIIEFFQNMVFSMME